MEATPDPGPLARSQDRFPLGPAGHRIPVTQDKLSGLRPWGMGCARPPVPMEGRHGKPTSTKQEKVPTEYTDDSKTKRDDYTQTVTD